jgi:RNA polymerase sigma factor (sigma-70 family)
MKPSTFEEAVVLYDRLIKGQMKKLSLYQNHEEYYQCGLIALWRAYEQFEEEKGDFSAYALHTVRGYLLVQLNKERRFQDTHTCWNPDMTAQVAAEETGGDDIHSYTKVLNDEQRYVIEERFKAGRKLKDIAMQMGITYDRARYLYRSAMQKMKQNVVRN